MKLKIKFIQNSIKIRISKFRIMNKKILIATIIILLVVAIVIAAKLFSGEDSWICQDGQWVRHGNPSAAMPANGCDDNDQQGSGFQQNEEIIVTLPQANQAINSPLKIEGKAKGSWFFEAVFPVKLVDANGNNLAASQVQAIGDWMSEDFVPFEAELDFKKSTTPTGTLIFHSDNPSGLPENDKEFSVPVRFE